MIDQHCQSVREVEEAWNRGRLAELDRYFAPGFISHAAIPILPPGLDGAKQAHQMSMSVFPDRQVEVVDCFGSGDRVFVRTVVRGTNSGGAPWLAAAANDRPFEADAWSVYRFQDGLIAEHWGLNDDAAMMRQLGSHPRG